MKTAERFGKFLEREILENFSNTKPNFMSTNVNFTMGVSGFGQTGGFGSGGVSTINGTQSRGIDPYGMTDPNLSIGGIDRITKKYMDTVRQWQQKMADMPGYHENPDQEIPEIVIDKILRMDIEPDYQSYRIWMEIKVDDVVYDAEIRNWGSDAEKFYSSFLENPMLIRFHTNFLKIIPLQIKKALTNWFIPNPGIWKLVIDEIQVTSPNGEHQIIKKGEKVDVIKVISSNKEVRFKLGNSKIYTLQGRLFWIWNWIFIPVS